MNEMPKSASYLAFIFVMLFQASPVPWTVSVFFFFKEGMEKKTIKVINHSCLYYSLCLSIFEAKVIFSSFKVQNPI